MQLSKGIEGMANFTINYVTASGRGPHSYSNTILNAPSREAAEAMFKAVMNRPETHITSVQQVDDMNVVSPVFYRELIRMAE